MTEWIFTSSLLIILIFGLRFLLKGRIPPRLQYALWLLVLLRLLIPFQIGSSPVSAISVAEKFAPISPAPTVSTPIAEENSAQTQPQAPITQRPSSQTPIRESDGDAPVSLTVTQVLLILWVTGAFILGLVMIISNLRLKQKLKSSCDPSTDDPRVFRGAVVESPFLFGIVRPKIYLPANCSSQDLPYVLAHEQAHYANADHIWAILRCICLCVHWYNPLVWAAAFASKADGEMACDEKAIRTLGEDQRISYGNALIRLSCAKPGLGNLVNTATTMDSSKRSLRNRVKQIAKHPKTPLVAIVFIIITAILAGIFVFTGYEKSEAPKKSDHPVYQDEGIQGAFLFTYKSLYVWDHTAEAPIPRDGIATRAGTVKENNIHTIPSTEYAACRLAVGTEIYTDATYDRIYTKPGPEGSGLEYGVFVPVLEIPCWWQESVPQAGYYSMLLSETYIGTSIQNSSMGPDQYYIYLDGEGGGQYIYNGFSTDLTSHGDTLEISSNFSLQYRVDGNVLTTNRGTYLYQGTTAPILRPSDPILPGDYRIYGEVGTTPIYSHSNQSLTIQNDNTGILSWNGETYAVKITEDGFYLDDKPATAYYDAQKQKGAIILQLGKDQYILYITQAPIIYMLDPIEVIPN